MPINKAEIRTLIPHSDLMCLLDEVVQWDDRSIACVSNTHRDPANPLRRQGRLSAVHAFEYGAQAAAVHGGFRGRGAGARSAPRDLGWVWGGAVPPKKIGVNSFSGSGFLTGVFCRRGHNWCEC